MPSKPQVKEPRRIANLSDANLLRREEVRQQIDADTAQFARVREAASDCNLPWNFYYNFNEFSLGLPHESQLTLIYQHQYPANGVKFDSGVGSPGINSSSSEDSVRTDFFARCPLLTASYGAHVQWNLYYKDPQELRKVIIRLNATVASAFMDLKCDVQSLISVDTAIVSIETLTQSLTDDINKLLRKCRMMYQCYDENSHPSRSERINSAMQAICEFLCVSRLSFLGPMLQPNPAFVKAKNVVEDAEQQQQQQQQFQQSKLSLLPSIVMSSGSELISRTTALNSSVMVSSEDIASAAADLVKRSSPFQAKLSAMDIGPEFGEAGNSTSSDEMAKVPGRDPVACPYLKMTESAVEIVHIRDKFDGAEVSNRRHLRATLLRSLFPIARLCMRRWDMDRESPCGKRWLFISDTYLGLMNLRTKVIEEIMLFDASFTVRWQKRISQTQFILSNRHLELTVECGSVLKRRFLLGAVREQIQADGRPGRDFTQEVMDFKSLSSKWYQRRAADGSGSSEKYKRHNAAVSSSAAGSSEKFAASSVPRDNSGGFEDEAANSRITMDSQDSLVGSSGGGGGGVGNASSDDDEDDEDASDYDEESQTVNLDADSEDSQSQLSSRDGGDAEVAGYPRGAALTVSGADVKGSAKSVGSKPASKRAFQSGVSLLSTEDAATKSSMPQKQQLTQKQKRDEQRHRRRIEKDSQRLLGRQTRRGRRNGALRSTVRTDAPNEDAASGEESGPGGDGIGTFHTKLRLAQRLYRLWRGPAAPSRSHAWRRPFGSFVPARDGVKAQWYLDGAAYMYAVADAIDGAAHEIWICANQLVPEIYLRRPDPEGRFQLGALLSRKAAAGVRVFLLLDNPSSVVGVNYAMHVVDYFEGVPNVHVLLHPPDLDAACCSIARNLWAVLRALLVARKRMYVACFNGYCGKHSEMDDRPCHCCFRSQKRGTQSRTERLHFSHNEKFIVIDQKVALVSAVDLTWGVWDTSYHIVNDLPTAQYHSSSDARVKRPDVRTQDVVENYWSRPQFQCEVLAPESMASLPDGHLSAVVASEEGEQTMSRKTVFLQGHLRHLQRPPDTLGCNSDYDKFSANPVTRMTKPFSPYHDITDTTLDAKYLEVTRSLDEKFKSTMRSAMVQEDRLVNLPSLREVSRPDTVGRSMSEPAYANQLFPAGKYTTDRQPAASSAPSGGAVNERTVSTTDLENEFNSLLPRRVPNFADELASVRLAEKSLQFMLPSFVPATGILSTPMVAPTDLLTYPSGGGRELTVAVSVARDVSPSASVCNSSSVPPPIGGENNNSTDRRDLTSGDDTSYDFADAAPGEDNEYYNFDGGSGSRREKRGVSGGSSGGGDKPVNVCVAQCMRLQRLPAKRTSSDMSDDSDSSDPEETPAGQLTRLKRRLLLSRAKSATNAVSRKSSGIFISTRTAIERHLDTLRRKLRQSQLNDPTAAMAAAAAAAGGNLFELQTGGSKSILLEHVEAGAAALPKLRRHYAMKEDGTRFTTRLFPGLDYWNPHLMPITQAHAGNPDNPPGHLDPTRHPRLPVHSAGIAMFGKGARDVARHFIERWNFARNNYIHGLKKWHNIGATYTQSAQILQIPLLAPRCYAAHDLDDIETRVGRRRYLHPATDFLYNTGVSTDFSKANVSFLQINLGEREMSEAGRPVDDEVANGLGVKFNGIDSTVDALRRPSKTQDDAKDEILVEDEEFVNCMERLDQGRGLHTCRVSVLRSLGRWSGGAHRYAEENSVLLAYYSAIAQAQRFVYIENELFISQGRNRPVDVTIKNRISFYLYKRILQARARMEPFKVYIVIPLFPKNEGQLLNGSRGDYTSRKQMHYIYQTVFRGEDSLTHRLLQRHIPPFEHLSVCCLQKFDRLPDGWLAQDIYVQSNLMIVDDRITIIGSPRLADHSLLGYRNSELAIRLEDPQGNGFARSLRLALWGEHLDVPPGEREALLGDPGDSAVWNLWGSQARSNSQIMQEVFRSFPNNAAYTMTRLKDFSSISYLQRRAKLYSSDRDTVTQGLERLCSVKGHLVVCSGCFLEGSQLTHVTNTEQRWRSCFFWPDFTLV